MAVCWAYSLCTNLGR